MTYIMLILLDILYLYDFIDFLVLQPATLAGDHAIEVKGDGHQPFAIVALHGKVQMGARAVAGIAGLGDHLAGRHRLTDRNTGRGGTQVDIDGHGAIRV